MNLIIILAILFGSLFLIVHLLEGKAEPLSDEQQSNLSRWIMIAVFISIIVAIISRL